MPLSAISDEFPNTDPEVLEKFLVLIRDNIGVVDEAIYHLEQRTGISDTSVLTYGSNILILFAEILDHEGISRDEQSRRLSDAEQSLRDAIEGCYKPSIKSAFLRVKKSTFFYSIFVWILLRPFHRLLGISKAPTLEVLKSRTKAANDLVISASNDLQRSVFDPAWHNGIKNYALAIAKLEDDTLEEMEKFIRPAIYIIMAILALVFTSIGILVVF